ncbi:glycosyl transferase family 1 [Agrobacterium tumefaciens]|nr:glycosyl transferase family 1 [Agrobacterium tumefaciens]
MVASRDDEKILVENLIADIGSISSEVDSLQRGNWTNSMSLTRLVKRLVYARLLYRLSEWNWLSQRRRERFLKSAKKRDPMLLVQKVDDFCVNYYRRINNNKLLSERFSGYDSKNGLTVTAIVPNYNHARYLPKRLDSILNQTYPLVDIIVLDDCSTDDSRAIIELYVNKYPSRIRALLSTENSGNVFHQWQKGHAQAKGDIVWICESDDFCEPSFVERAIRSFRDSSVMLSFGRVEYANSDGEYVEGLNNYREESEPGIWDQTTVRPAFEWFCGGFGVRNIIPNVGGSLWRRHHIHSDNWRKASEFKVMGDWFLYSAVAGGGQIAYEPTAVSYFRIHANNTSGRKAQSTPEYYGEYFRLMKLLKAKWPIPKPTLDRFVASSYRVFKRSRISGQKFENLVNSRELGATRRRQHHILVGLMGFSLGGGEIFPVHLANALHQLGAVVSVLQMHSNDDQPQVRRLLDPAIPVYNADHVRELGPAKFLKQAGVSLVHSHVANVDRLFLDRGTLPCAYMSTLHGSYEAMKISKTSIDRWSRKIGRFAYLADRNLVPFEGLKVQESKFIKVRNAVPLDDRPFPKTRADLGIPADAIVFCLASRAVEGKGWVEAVKAYLKLRERRPDIPMALLMAGEGATVKDAKAWADKEPTVHFLGFISEVHGLYRISDVALLPSRYGGESFPLSLIQAFQVGVPCIATDIGEIKRMAGGESKEAGIIFEPTDDNESFIQDLSAAMEKMLDHATRSNFRDNAALVGQSFDIDKLAAEYLREYLSLIESHLGEP